MSANIICLFKWPIQLPNTVTDLGMEFPSMQISKCTKTRVTKYFVKFKVPSCFQKHFNLLVIPRHRCNPLTSAKSTYVIIRISGSRAHWGLCYLSRGDRTGNSFTTKCFTVWNQLRNHRTCNSSTPIYDASNRICHNSVRKGLNKVNF